MKNLKFIVVVAIVASTISLSSCTSTFEFENVKTPDSTLSIERGNSFQSVENNDIEMSLHGKAVEEENEACIVADIKNKSRFSTYRFQDSKVAIYEGNIDKDYWNKIEDWDASSYYKKVKNDAQTSEFFQSLSGVINIANASSDANSNNSNTTNTDVLLTSFVENQKMRNLVDANEHQISFLENNLLYTSDIKAGDNYNGVLLFPVNNNYPDYKITYSDDYSDPLNFYFNRSDRVEVLNPWLDQKGSRVGVVVEHSHFRDATSLTMYYCNDKTLGYYVGVDYYSLGKKLSDLEATDKPKFSGFGYCVGGNLKVSSHTWLLMGIDMVMGQSYVSLDNPLASTYNYTIESDCAHSDLEYDLGFQLGINTIFNFIDISAKLNWLIDNGLYAQVGLGYAF
jgi:hypothetical protein